jgi:hypothetical protein
MRLYSLGIFLGEKFVGVFTLKIMVKYSYIVIKRKLNRIIYLL